MNKFLLKNKATLIVDYIPTVETFSVKIGFHVGSRDEEGFPSGISHLIEHMMFKGTATRNVHDIAMEFESMGAIINASTGQTTTIYDAKAMKEYIKPVMILWLDMLQNSLFSEDELEREKKVVLDEISRYKDMPDSELNDLMFTKFFPKSQLGLPIIGAPESVMSITRDQILSYIRKYYTYDNMMIAISGNIDPEYTRDLCEELFTDIPSANQLQIDRKYDAKRDVPNYHGGNDAKNKDIEQVHIGVAFPGVSAQENDYYTQKLVTIIGGGGMSARLFREVREKRGLCYSIYMHDIAFDNVGVWGFDGITSPKNARELIEISIEQIRDMAYNVDYKELEKAKNQLKMSLVTGLESTSGRANRIISNQFVFGKQIPIDDIIKKIDSITTDEIKNFVLKYLIDVKWSQDYKPTCCIVGKIDDIYTEEIFKAFNEAMGI